MVERDDITVRKTDEPTTREVLRAVQQLQERLCNVEIFEGHKIGCFNENGSEVKFMPSGTKAAAAYLFETMCGTFTCLLIGKSFVYLEADKTKVVLA